MSDYAALDRPSASVQTIERPRLWDVSTDAKAALISAEVVADSVRTVEFALCALIGLVVAAAYVSNLNEAMHASYLIAAFATAGISVVSFELLGDRKSVV